MTDSFSLQNGTPVYTDSNEKPSMAAFILASFAAVQGKKNVLELCSGSGIVSFWNYDRGFNGHTVMVDLRDEQLKLAEMTATRNGFDVEIYCQDVLIYRSENKFDAVVCNPPFFYENSVSSDPDKKAVRHENGLDTAKLFKVAASNIKQRGHFYLCHVPDRLPDLFESMRASGFEPKVIRFCRHSADRLPFLVLIDALFKGGKKLTVLPDLNVFDEKGNYTEEMIDICERGFI